MDDPILAIHRKKLKERGRYLDRYDKYHHYRGMQYFNIVFLIKNCRASLSFKNPFKKL